MATLLSDDFIKAIPKTDLHVHLDGSVRVSTLIELASEIGLELPATTEEELRRTVFPDKYASLVDYLRGFQYTNAIMRTAPALERIAYEFAVDNFDEGVRYVESRFAPQLHAGANNKDLSLVEVITAINAGFAKAKAEYNAHPKVVSGEEPAYEYGLIMCALRIITPEMSPYYATFLDIHRHEDARRVQSLASMALVTTAVTLRQNSGLPIVALDIAGPEAGFPASVHTDAYAFAHKNFLHKTVHAGEAFGPQSIFQAITDLHADRIGHGLRLFAMDELAEMGEEKAKAYIGFLAEYIADRRILVEVCLSSNLQTSPSLKLEDHPLKDMLANRISTSLCTDNRLMSNTTVVKETQLARDHLHITPRQLKDMVIGGFKRSFFPGTYVEKRSYVRHIIQHYENLEAKFGIVDRSVTPTPRGVTAGAGAAATDGPKPPKLPRTTA